MNDDFQQRLGQLKATGEARRSPECPSEIKWWDLAAGLVPESQAAELIDHSTRCDACGLLFRQATHEFADEATELETAQLAALTSAKEEWQRNLAQDLRGRRAGGRAIYRENCSRAFARQYSATVLRGECICCGGIDIQH